MSGVSGVALGCATAVAMLPVTLGGGGHVGAQSGGWSPLELGAVVVVAGCTLLLGVSWLARRRHADGATAVLNAAPPAQAAPTRPGPRTEMRVRTDRMCAAFNEWREENEERADVWRSFDQLLRELLVEQFGAGRVRCFHVQPGRETLLTISQSRAESVSEGPSLRAGILGHAATSGKEFVAGDPTQGALVHDLAERGDDDWTWVWPVRHDGATVGVVAVGNLRDAAILDGEVRQAVGQLLTVFWSHVACAEQLRISQRTDQASGVLTRNDFFARARLCLADSYRANEPVVVVVLALEGLRRLDDAGRWSERDELIERVGQLVADRLRSDDVVGRFADDRFVVLLRRLDSGLGQLITEKMLTAATECMAPSIADDALIQVRAGLAGSGFAQPALEDLLVHAFGAVEQARAEQRAMLTDLPESSREVGDA